MSSDPARGIPVLASLEFGFSVGYEEPHYLIVRRDDIELHFWKTDQRQFPRIHPATYAAAGRRRFSGSTRRTAWRGLDEFL